MEEVDYEGSGYDGGSDQVQVASNRRDGGRIREGRNWEDNNLGNIKKKIPSFQGKNDPEVYLDWEKKVELIFECHNYSEAKKVKLATIEFFDYAIVGGINY